MKNPAAWSEDERQRMEVLALLGGEVYGLLRGTYLILGNLVIETKWRTSVLALADRFEGLARMMRQTCDDEGCDLSRPPSPPPGVGGK